MKKLFTFLMAMAFVTMSFAQGLLINTTTEVQLPAPDRTDWYGYYASSSSVFVMAAGSEYTLRIPQGDIPAGAQLTKVRFYHTNSDHVTGLPAGTTFFNTTYRIRIYTGTVYNESGHNITPGDVAETFVYEAPEGDAGVGIQIADISSLNFTMPATGDVTIGIYAEDMAACGLCPVDESCAAHSFAYFSDESDAGYHHWVFGSSYDEEGNLIANHKPFLLSVYYEDDQPYQKKCDLSTAIHRPEDNSNWPEEVEELIVDNWTDSLYLNCELVNNGPDDAYGTVTLSCYVEYNGVQTPIFEDPTYDFSELEGQDFAGYLPVLVGLPKLDYGGILELNNEEDPEAVTEFEELNLGWPFQLCVHVDFYSTDGAIDQNLDNNTYCVTVHNRDVEAGIQNVANNTLKVSPNPANTYINVENAAGSQIFVYNIAGQEVMAIESAEANERLNVSNLNAGLYIVRVINGAEISTAKVSIVR